MGKLISRTSLVRLFKRLLISLVAHLVVPYCFTRSSRSSRSHKARRLASSCSTVLCCLCSIAWMLGLSLVSKIAILCLWKVIISSSIFTRPLKSPTTRIIDQNVWRQISLIYFIKSPVFKVLRTEELWDYACSEPHHVCAVTKAAYHYYTSFFKHFTYKSLRPFIIPAQSLHRR